MPATLYLRPSPRAFFLLTETHALVFRQPDASESKASRSVVVAEFLPIEEVDTRGLIKASRGRTVEGVLGVTSVPSERSPIPEIFLLLVSACSPLSPLLPSHPFRPAKVIAVEFHSLTSTFWDSPELVASSNSYLEDEDLDDPYSSYHAGPSTTQSQAESQRVEHPCGGMKKYLESGGFFYAEDCNWDISTRMGETNWLQKGGTHPLETFDERFIWNASLLSPLLAFRNGLPIDIRQTLDNQNLIIPVIQGFVGSLPVSTGARTPNGRPEIAALGMISRLSWKRAGARFRTRGIDDDGQVANFVETECILATNTVCASYVQVRGSVPLFWQQPSAGLGTLQQKVELTRPPQATQPAFDKHFLELLEQYHSVHAVNLLGQKDAESMLSTAYSDHLEALKSTLDHDNIEEKGQRTPASRSLDLTHYDFHAAVKIGGHDSVRYDFGTRLREVTNSMERFGWTTIDATSGQVVEQQEGIFRVNCLDCLDRTNYVQDVISSLTLTRFLTSISSPLASSPSLWSAHRELWADNGDRLSKIYAGTGALNTSATRTGKKTFAGLLSDATKSVGRAYINNFQDKGKQAAIDMLLGMMAGQRPVILFDPISDSVQTALLVRENEFSSTRKMSIFVGTWNLNGKLPDESLDPWLFPSGRPTADIYMIAFQEIVELTAGQILQTDPAKRRTWEKYLMDTFGMHETGKGNYTLFRSEQLVGTALIIIVKTSIMSSIRSVETANKKTGLQGLSGNKGGVGIRLNLYDSTLCFMTCHLAAGHSNVSERNADYRTISHGLKFLKGKSIEDHDIIIWAADFNYRIALPNPEVREYAETDQLDNLITSDQLMQAMDEGEVFHGYKEGPIRFRPTYKYDNGSDEYDTSEKARIPAWTDRILWRGPLKQKSYDRAELRISDHRPVYAMFDAAIKEVDQRKKDTITQEIVARLRKNVGYEKVDDKVEKAVRTGGVGKIAEKMVAKPPIPTGAKPSRKPAPTVPPELVVGLSQPKPVIPVNGISKQNSPRIPPRPRMSTDDFPVDLQTPIVPSRSPDPASRSPNMAATSKSPNAIAAARAVFEKSSTPDVPPIRTRSDTSKSGVATPPALPARPSPTAIAVSQLSSNNPARQTPPLPSRTRSRSSTLTTSDTGSTAKGSITSVITPASTGDYVVISSSLAEKSKSSAPPLPSRPIQTPQRSRTLDLDGSPPDGLTSPVKPVSAIGVSKKPPPVIPSKPPNLRSTSSSQGS